MSETKSDYANARKEGPPKVFGVSMVWFHQGGWTTHLKGKYRVIVRQTVVSLPVIGTRWEATVDFGTEATLLFTAHGETAQVALDAIEWKRCGIDLVSWSGVKEYVFRRTEASKAYRAALQRAADASSMISVLDEMIIRDGFGEPVIQALNEPSSGDAET